MDKHNSNRDTAHAIAIAARLTHSIGSLPGVGTMDWAERAASCIASALEASWVGVAMNVVPVPPRLPVLLVGVSAVSPPQPEHRAIEDELRDSGSGLWTRVREGRLDAPGLEREGATGVVLRSHETRLPTHFVRAIVIADGGEVPPELMNDLLKLAAAEAANKAGVAFQPNPAGEIPILTEKECEVVELLCLGFRPVDVGIKMHRSKHTVHEHAKAAHAKIGVDSRARLIARFFGRPISE